MDRMITRADIEQFNLSLDDIAQSIGEAFLAGAAGDIIWRPKTMLSGPGGSFQMSTYASWAQRDLSIFHMLFGPSAEAIRNGAPGYTSRQYVAERASGLPLGLIDGTYTSNMLPAGVARLLTGRLTQPRSGVAVIVGAGTQARLNLEALDGVLPISEVRIVTRSQASAEAFAEFVRKRGQTPIIASASEATIADADVVISTIPASPGLVPFMDPAWVRPGTFVNMVDLGRSWKQGFEAFDRVIVDDRDQAEQQFRDGRLLHGGPFDSEISDIVSGNRPGRVNADERIVLVHPGNVVGVIGVTAALLRALGATEPR
jgi:alanine dehydrogenase